MSTTTTTSVPAGTYEIDPVHSSFGFAVGHNGVSRFRGHFDNVAATLVDGVLTGSATVESVRTPIPPLKDHLTGPEFFDAASTPTIDFRSSEIRVSEENIRKTPSRSVIVSLISDWSWSASRCRP